MDNLELDVRQHPNFVCMFRDGLGQWLVTVKDPRHPTVFLTSVDKDKDKALEQARRRLG